MDEDPEAGTEGVTSCAGKSSTTVAFNRWFNVLLSVGQFHININEFGITCLLKLYQNFTVLHLSLARRVSTRKRIFQRFINAMITYCY
jgi:hypothetical protein